MALVLASLTLFSLVKSNPIYTCTRAGAGPYSELYDESQYRKCGSDCNCRVFEGICLYKMPPN